MKDKYTIRSDGELRDITGGEYLSCCDCGLVHRVEYYSLNGQILAISTRNTKETANRRKRKDIKASIKELKHS